MSTLTTTTMTAVENISVEDIKAGGEPVLENLIYKLSIEAGAGEELPENSEVEVDLRMFVGNQSIRKYTEKPLVKQVEHILPTGLSIAIATMRKGERALIWMDSSMGFGTATLMLEPGVKPIKDRNLVFEVRLKSWTESLVSSRSKLRKKYSPENLPGLEEAFKKAELKEQTGRNFEALQLFRSTLYEARKLRIDAKESPEQEKLRQELVFQLEVKTAECAYKTGRYPLAVTVSRQALQTYPLDAHVNYICGCAYHSLGFMRSATHFMRQAHFNDLLNKIYKKKMHEIEKHQALLEKDVDSESVREGYEDFAAHSLRKLTETEEQLEKDVKKFVNRRFKKGDSAIQIGGGFRPAFIKRFADRILEMSEKDPSLRIRLINSEDDVLQLEL